MSTTSSVVTSPTVLIVDDTPENLSVLLNILTNEGYQVRPAINGQIALKVAHKISPDIILLDIMMPGMDGYEVCRQLKTDETTREIPVIFISAMHETQDKIEAFRIGGVDYITKPFQAEEVVARVRTHVALWSMQKQLQTQNLQLQQEIADRKRIEEALQQAKEVADAANHAKSAFLANMSHELRTPLNAILGLTQVCAFDQTLTAEQRKNLAIINRSGEHLLTLINQVLDLSKVEAGKMVLFTTEFDLHKLVRELIDLFRLRTEGKGLYLTLACGMDVPQYVRTDAVKLRQILINLLSNAVKFTDQGGVTLRVHCPHPNPLPEGEGAIPPSPLRRGAGGEVHLVFEIEDTGPGIAPEEQAVLFEAFTQATAGEASHEGTGLGLTISQRFVRLLGGEITVKSDIGHGATFLFVLPVKVSNTQDALSEEGEGPQGQGQRPKVVLSAAAFQALPPPLVRDLGQAAVIADIARIFELIEQVRTYDATLADGLTEFADNFQYGRILELIHQGEK